MKLKRNMRQLFDRYHIAIGAIILLIGIILRILSLYYSNLTWRLFGDLGTFLAVAIAIPFIYNLFIRKKDREIFIDDLNHLIDKKISSIKSISKKPIFFEYGRRTIAEKISFYERATSMVIEVGIGLRTFSSYFEQRSAHEFQDHITKLLKKGIIFKVLMLDPESEIAKIYIKNHNESSYIGEMQKSLTKLKEICNFYARKNLPGSFELYTYSQIPYFHGVFVDIENDEGYMFISHYLISVKRADAPGYEFSKKSNPIMFNKYKTSILQLLKNSKDCFRQE